MPSKATITQSRTTPTDCSDLSLADYGQTLDGEIALLQRIKAFNDNAIREVEGFVGNANLSALAIDYNENLKKRNADIGFNLFELISDHYYRETFHSDILNAFLDPKSKHQEQKKYLHLFLEFIRSQGATIDVDDYEHAQVEKEQGKIDILILGNSKAIIIENKINDAPDMPRQLPRYLEYVRAKGYACEAIIYLRLNGYVGPDTTGWYDGESKQVDALLKVICAYDETENDLLNGWILKCGNVSDNNPDAQHILRQYGDVIKKLGGNIMNKPIMESFYRIIVEGENLKTALSLKAMVDELILYRVERIIDKFKSDLAPFKKIANYANNDAYLTNFFWNDTHLGIDIVVETESYLFQFWDRNDPGCAKEQAKVILQKMGCLDEYNHRGGRFEKIFQFPSQEEALIEHITTFKKKLGEAVKSLSIPVA